MLVLYFQTPNGPERWAEFRLNNDSTVSVNIVHASGGAIDRIGINGVGSRSLRRQVLPKEGQIFLDAIRESYGSATYWMVREEPDNS